MTDLILKDDLQEKINANKLKLKPLRRQIARLKKLPNTRENEYKKRDISRLQQEMRDIENLTNKYRTYLVEKNEYKDDTP
jgi:hypothetical protein